MLIDLLTLDVVSRISRFVDLGSRCWSLVLAVTELTLALERTAGFLSIGAFVLDIGASSRFVSGLRPDPSSSLWWWSGDLGSGTVRLMP